MKSTLHISPRWISVSLQDVVAVSTLGQPEGSLEEQQQGQLTSVRAPGPACCQVVGEPTGTGTFAGSGIAGAAPAHFHLGVVLIFFGAETLMAEGLTFPHSFPVCQQGDLGLCAPKQHLVVRGAFCPSCSQH